MSTSLFLSGSTVSSSFLSPSKRSLLRNPKPSLLPFRNASRTFKPLKCSADSPYGGNVPTFPRTRVWDPYKRLGISPYASEEEIWASRNFLLEQYAGHERSQESIEGAFEKLLMSSFIKRKKSKINLKTRLKKKVEESPPWLKALLDFVEMPTMDTVFRRLFLFAFMGGWSIMNSAEGGPAFQVAVSLAACVYFLNEKTKSLGRACLIGFGALAAGWFCGSLVIPMIPTVLINPAWGLELLTSLVAYVFLFLSCTFLKHKLAGLNFLFAFMGGWGIMNSAEGGPAFQVAVSLVACVYFLNEKTKSLGRSCLIGFGALAAGWFCGSLVIPMIPTVLINPAWGLELLTSLVAYVFLFLSCTFLK